MQTTKTKPDIEIPTSFQPENKEEPYIYHTRKRVSRFRNSLDNLDDLKARENLDMQSILTPYDNEFSNRGPATPTGLV